MAKDPFNEEMKAIDQEQRAMVARIVGLPILSVNSDEPNSPIIETAIEEKKSNIAVTGITAIFGIVTAMSSMSGLINGSLVSGMALVGAISIGIIDPSDIQNSNLCFHHVTDEGVNVRTGPGLYFDNPLQLSNGTNVNILGYTQDDDGRENDAGQIYEWAQVELINSEGEVVHFIREDNIQKYIFPRICRTLEL